MPRNNTNPAHTTKMVRATVGKLMDMGEMEDSGLRIED
jgi:hypothetical protein